MAAFVVFDEFIFNLGQKLIDLDTDTFRAALTNTAPTQATDDELADITQIANGNGYTTAADGAGLALVSPTWAETGAGTGIWKWSADDFSWTASGGAIATFRYVVLFSDTSTNNKLVGYWDYGSAVDLAVGNTFTVDIGANGIFQIAVP